MGGLEFRVSGTAFQQAGGRPHTSKNRIYKTYYEILDYTILYYNLPFWGVPFLFHYPRLWVQDFCIGALGLGVALNTQLLRRLTAVPTTKAALSPGV